jgi:hypothetical protein
MRRLLLLLTLLPALFASEAWRSPHNGNPIIPGYYADASLVKDGDTWVLYATLDPWGGETLGCWTSTDFANWTYRVLNWPTKTACTSPTSKGAMVWAPSVIKAPDGRFHMFVSVGSEVWTGVANSPLGPWRDALQGRPLIPVTWDKRYHMIDAEAFVDDDGSVYLYWGSGWNWVNGHCFVVKLKRTLDGFDGEPRDVTPPHYFEGPFMFRHQGRYYLSYSHGRTDQDSYQVHYAIGDSPLGPFREPGPAPLLASTPDREVLSPGHHAFFRYQGQPYILYHRQALPFVPDGPILRQLCVDPLRFNVDGTLSPVSPSHQPPAWLRRHSPPLPATLSASSQAAGGFGAEAAGDDNYATRWMPAPDDQAPWLQLDFGSVRELPATQLRFEYAWKPYAFRVEASEDGRIWRLILDHLKSPVAGSPIHVPAGAKARFLRLSFPPADHQAVALFEWECASP